MAIVHQAGIANVGAVADAPDFLANVRAALPRASGRSVFGRAARDVDDSAHNEDCQCSHAG